MDLQKRKTVHSTLGLDTLSDKLDIMMEPGYNRLNPTISIITVVYNCESLIEKTIQSVMDQSYPNIEYILVDGDSKDKTLDIIKKYENPKIKWISEPDKGLYDAMNKGMDMAKGDYLWFINAGDLIYSKQSTSQIFENLDFLPDVIYGETEIIDIQGNSIGMRRHSTPENLNWKDFANGMLVCHQSVLVKKQIAEKYNLHYKYSSDFDWVIKAFRKAKTIYNSKQILSKFLEGGQTSKNLVSGLKERFRIMKKNYGLAKTLAKHIVLAIRLLIYYFKNKRI